MNEPKKISKLLSKSEECVHNEQKVSLIQPVKPDSSTGLNLPGKQLPLGCIEVEPHQLDFFIDDEYNRKLNQNGLTQLIKDKNICANATDYPFSEPVVAWWNPKIKKLVLKDGHHRVAACRILGTKVRYTAVEEDYCIFAGKRSGNMRWLSFNLIEGYAKKGDFSYKQLVKLHDLHPGYQYPTLTLFFNLETTSDAKLRYKEFKISEEHPVSKLNPNGDLTAFELAELRLTMFEQFNAAAKRNDCSKELIKNLLIAFEHPDFDFDYFIKRTTANAGAALARPELSKSISTNVRARYLIQFYYNEYSKAKAFYF